MTAGLARLKGAVVGRYAVLARIWRHPFNRGTRRRAFADYLFWNAARFSLDARIAVELPCDVELILGRRENYGSSVYVHGLADPAEMLLLAHALREGDLFVDVGANVGMYSIWVSRATGAQALAFEPVARNFERLQKNIRLNDLGDRVTAHKVAVGDRDGTVRLTVGEGARDHVVFSGETEAAAEVPVRRLDDLLGARRPYAMKIDVEGFEMQALHGAQETLRRSVQIVVIEMQDWTLRKYNSSEEAVRAYLRELGFSEVDYDPFSRKLSPSLGKSDLNEIFVKDGCDIERRLAEGRKVALTGYPEGI